MNGANSDNFCVAVRVRPPTTDGTLLNIIDQKTIIFDPQTAQPKQNIFAHKSKRNKQITYSFDKVFDKHTTQQTVYENTVKPLITQVLQGYNATVFAYGATGCGKTHTITGTKENPGIIFRTIQDLFQNHSTELTISFLEVYNETIKDLLTPSSKTLDLREDENKVAISGLTHHTPRDYAHIMEMLIKGNDNRTKASTEANAVSSRSHAVVQIHVKQRNEDVNCFATLSIIDLAGSERASATKNQGDRMVEGANINRSLLALGNCINALCTSASTSKTVHIPYRDSKLTRLLKFSLSGNCKVVMIANVSSSPIHYEETLSTLKYANRAKNIKTRVVKNEVTIDYPEIVRELRERIEKLTVERNEFQKQPLMQKPIQTGPITRLKSKSTTLRIQSLYTSTINFINRTFSEKIHPKSLDIAISNVSITVNEHRLVFLGELASTSLIFKAVEDLHTWNTALRYNTTQTQESVDGYREKVNEKVVGFFREVDGCSLNDELLGMGEKLKFEVERLENEGREMIIEKERGFWNECYQVLAREHLHLTKSIISNDTEKVKEVLDKIIADSVRIGDGLTSSTSIEPTINYESCEESESESGYIQEVDEEELDSINDLPMDIPMIEGLVSTNETSSEMSSIRTATNEKNKRAPVLVEEVQECDITPTIARLNEIKRNEFSPSNLLSLFQQQQQQQQQQPPYPPLPNNGVTSSTRLPMNTTKQSSDVGGPIRASPLHRQKRNKARQSLIPVMAFKKPKVQNETEGSKMTPRKLSKKDTSRFIGKIGKRK